MRILFSLLALCAVSSAQEFQSLLWSQNGKDRELFGSAVALDGERLVVGAVGAKPGRLYVYRRSGRNWIEEARLGTFQDGVDQTGGFGWNVQVDGDRIAAGASFFDGEVYLYDRSLTSMGGKWMQTRLFPPDAANEEGFGDEVELEGDTLAVKTYRGVHDSVYVFERTAGQWEETARFQDQHAQHIALSAERLVIAAEAGVLVQRRDGAGWTLETSFPERFAAVALEGDLLAILSRTLTFHRFDGQSWQLEGSLSGANGTELELDGDVAYLGSATSSIDQLSGRVQVFERIGGDWSATRLLVPTELEHVYEARFGVGLAAQDGTLVVGAHSYNGQGVDSGAVVTYARDGRRATLRGTPVHLSLVDGADYRLELDAGPELAGRTFLLGGSLTGASPGFRYRESWIPLHVRDPYFRASLVSGTLDADGRASVVVPIPPGSPAWLSRYSLHHAFVVLEEPRGIVHVSNVALGALINAHAP